MTTKEKRQLNQAVKELRAAADGARRSETALLAALERVRDQLMTVWSYEQQTSALPPEVSTALYVAYGTISAMCMHHPGRREK